MPSYEKNKASGLWSCRFREVDEDGKQRHKRLSGYKTKKEAQFAYEDYIKHLDELMKQRKLDAEQPRTDPNDMPFDELLASYMAFTKNRVKESSFYDIESKLRNRLVPFFTGKKMKEITPKMISDWIENIDYKYSSKMWILSTLASIYKYGEKYFDIKNIMPKVDRPRNLEPTKEMQIWTPEEFAAMITHVENRSIAMYLRMLYITGCRRGEGLALTWEDLDFKKHTVRINKSVTTKTREGAFKVTTTKNQSSVRTVSLPDFFIKELTDYKKEQKDATDVWCEQSFVFGGARPLPPSTVDHTFNVAIKKANIKQIRIHDLRHSCASLLISKNISVVGVSRHLGHKNIEQTLNTYAHLMPDDQIKIKIALDDLNGQL
ncbi:MAG: site-specific integrase [Clostridia bacterium]|nr:site-specific integrase [Clostridia bacterium]